MGGFLGIGGSSAKTDRGNQLAATQGEWNLFSYGLPTGQQQQKTGQGNLGQASDYFSKQRTAGRTDTAASAAPAINAQLAQSDAQKRQQSTTGTGRTGGTAELNREQGATDQSNIDNIINSTLQTNKKEGAAGLVQTGGLDLSNAIANLGISSSSIGDILGNATSSRGQSFDIAQQEGSAIGGLILAGLGL
jgi:hypothetical protein